MKQTRLSVAGKVDVTRLKSDSECRQQLDTAAALAPMKHMTNVKSRV